MGCSASKNRSPARNVVTPIRTPENNHEKMYKKIRSFGNIQEFYSRLVHLFKNRGLSIDDDIVDPDLYLCASAPILGIHDLILCLMQYQKSMSDFMKSRILGEDNSESMRSVTSLNDHIDKYYLKAIDFPADYIDDTDVKCGNQCKGGECQLDGCKEARANERIAKKNGDEYIRGSKSNDKCTSACKDANCKSKSCLAARTTARSVLEAVLAATKKLMKFHHCFNLVKLNEGDQEFVYTEEIWKDPHADWKANLFKKLNDTKREIERTRKKIDVKTDPFILECIRHKIKLLERKYANIREVIRGFNATKKILEKYPEKYPETI